MLLIGPPGSGQDAARPDHPGAAAGPRRRGRRSRRRSVASVAGVRPGPRAGPPAPGPGARTTRCRYAGMVGGGPRMSPGEVTLAAPRGAGLRRAARVRAGRARGAAPAAGGRQRGGGPGRAGRPSSRPASRFVAAMNPCPCGHGRRRRPVLLVPARASRSATGDACPGPLRDRIDLWVHVDRVPPALARRRSRPRDVGRGRGPGSRPRASASAPAPATCPTAGSAGGSCGPCAASTRPGRRGPCCSRSARGCRDAGRSACSASRARSRTSRARTGSALVHLDEAARFRAPAERPSPRRGRLMLGIGRHGPLGRSEADTVGVPRRATRRRVARRRPAARPERPATRRVPSGTPGSILAGVEGVGPVSFARLIGAFGSASAVLRASAERDAVPRLVAATAGLDGGSPTLTEQAAAAMRAAAASPERLLDPVRRSGVRRADPGGRGLPVAAAADRPPAAGPLSCTAMRRRSTALAPWRSSGHAGRPGSGGRPPDASRTASRRSARPSVSGLALGIDGGGARGRRPRRDARPSR